MKHEPPIYLYVHELVVEPGGYFTLGRNGDVLQSSMGTELIHALREMDHYIDCVSKTGYSRLMTVTFMALHDDEYYYAAPNLRMRSGKKV